MTSLPSLANVGGLLFLLFFVYAVLGQNFFWNVEDQVVNITIHIPDVITSEIIWY